MLHTHSGSSRRAFFDTSLRCGCAARIGLRRQRFGIGTPRAQARDWEVADRVGEPLKVAPVDDPAPQLWHARSPGVQCTLRAATHRFFSFLSSPILSGSDSSNVPSARLHECAAGEGVPHARYISRCAWRPSVYARTDGAQPIRLSVQ